MPVTSLVTVLQWWQVDKISPVKLFEESKSVTGFQLRNLLRGACSPHLAEPPVPGDLRVRHTGRSPSLRPCVLATRPELPLPDAYSH